MAWCLVKTQGQLYLYHLLGFEQCSSRLSLYWPSYPSKWRCFL